MRLKLAASGSKSGVGADFLQAQQARFQFRQIAPAGGHGGVHFVVREAAHIAEVKLDALFEEFDELRIAADQISERNGHAAFHDDLDHALRGAAQRERIARPGGRHADAETVAQRVQLIGQRHQSARS